MRAMASPGDGAARRDQTSDPQRIVDSAPSLIHTGRPDGYLDFFNQTWLRYVGRPLEDLEDWKWTAFIHPEDVDQIVEKWRASLASGEPFLHEARVLRADGEYRWMLHHKVALRGGSGQIVKWYGSSIDIEDRKRAEVQLRRSTEELQRSEFYLAEGQRLAHQGSWAFDPAGFNYWSPELFRMHGLDPGRKPPAVQEYLDCVHPQDRESVANLIQGILAQPSPFDATKRIVRPNGEIRYIRCVGVPVVENESLKKYVGSALDVTEQELVTQELRRREAYLAEAQRLSHTGSFGWNVLTDEHFWSDETFRIFEYENSWKISLPMILQRIHPQDRPSVKMAMAAAAHGAGIDLECRLLVPDGRIKYLHIVGKTGSDSTGGIEVIGAVMDVTARKRTEVELRRNKAHLTNAQRLSRTVSVGMEATTKRIFWSEESARIYGYAAATEPTPDLILQRVHPDDVDLIKSVLERAGQGGSEFDFEHRLLMPDGSIKHIHNLSHSLTNEAGNQEVVGAIMDITERRVAEEAIRRSEAYLAEAQRLSHTGSFGWKPDSGEIVWSDETYRIFEYGRAEKPTLEMVFQRIHPQDRALVQQIIDRASQTGADFEHENRLLLPDGRVRHVHAIARAVQNASGGREFIGAVTDITERKTAEDKIRRVVEAGILGIFIANVEGEIFEANQAFLQMLQYSRQDLVSGGLRWTDLSPADWRERDQRALTEALATGAIQPYEKEFLRKDGSRAPVLLGAALFEGANEGVVFVLDLSQQKRAEEKIREQEMEFRQILDLAPQLVAVYGLNLERLYANRVMLDYLRLGLEEWRRRSKFGDAVHPDEREQAAGHFDRAVSGGAGFECELRLRKGDGSYRWFLVRCNPVYDDKKQVMRWYVACTDIEDRKRAEQKLQQENIALREEIDKASMFEEIVGTSRPLKAVLSRIAKVGPTGSTVLITGETGTGKELIARAVHKRSQRSGCPFVNVNCAALPPTLVSSELFGHEKGAFTGATERRLGRFEMADGGTIFLDEVGELLPDTQAALLRVLQEREFERVGGGQPIQVDVRVIAATNRDLNAAVANGTFRQDLLYRLNVFPIEMPPLRERKDDILILVEYFVQRYANRAGRNIRSIDQKTLDLLQSYDWPGNIRELQNVIERSIILSSADVFSVDELWLSKRISPPPSRVEASPAFNVEPRTEREIILAALAETRGRVSGPSGAAAKLRVPPSTLETRIKALKINKQQFKFG
jgi:PAS domain S-box-containing protein